MKNFKLLLLLISFSILLISCSEEDSGPITFSFSYTWNPANENVLFPLIKDSNGNEIGSVGNANLFDIVKGETQTVDIKIDRGGEILQFSSFVDSELKKVLTDSPVNNGDTVSWDTAENIARVNGGSNNNSGNNNEKCKDWREYNTECLSSVSDGTGSSKAGIKSRVCRISETSTDITVRTEIEAINGGIDNINFYKGIKIFYGDGSVITVSKEEFNLKGKIIKEFTAKKLSINNQGKDWDELLSSAYLVVQCQNN